MSYTAIQKVTSNVDTTESETIKTINIFNILLGTILAPSPPMKNLWNALAVMALSGLVFSPALALAQEGDGKEEKKPEGKGDGEKKPEGKGDGEKKPEGKGDGKKDCGKNPQQIIEDLEAAGKKVNTAAVAAHFKKYHPKSNVCHCKCTHKKEKETDRKREQKKPEGEGKLPGGGVPKPGGVGR